MADLIGGRDVLSPDDAVDTRQQSGMGVDGNQARVGYRRKEDFGMQHAWQGSRVGDKVRSASHMQGTGDVPGKLFHERLPPRNSLRYSNICICKALER